MTCPRGLYHPLCKSGKHGDRIGRQEGLRRSGIVNDPNCAEDPQYILYILRLIGKVISVSLETVEIVAGLPELGIDEAVSDGEGVP